MTLPQQGFQPLRVEAYGLIALKDTGSIRQLEGLHTAPEPWFVQEITVLNETTGMMGVFQANRCVCVCGHVC
jgi:hypothetical protein